MLIYREYENIPPHLIYIKGIPEFGTKISLHLLVMLIYRVYRGVPTTLPTYFHYFGSLPYFATKVQSILPIDSIRDLVITKTLIKCLHDIASHTKLLTPLHFANNYGNK